MRCLRPGGIAVHTTEFNLDGHGPHAARGSRPCSTSAAHLEALASALAAAGHRHAAGG